MKKYWTAYTAYNKPTQNKAVILKEFSNEMAAEFNLNDANVTLNCTLDAVQFASQFEHVINDIQFNNCERSDDDLLHATQELEQTLDYADALDGEAVHDELILATQIAEAQYQDKSEDGNDDKINEEDPSAHEEMASQRFQFENDDSYAALMQRR